MGILYAMTPMNEMKQTMPMNFIQHLIRSTEASFCNFKIMKINVDVLLLLYTFHLAKRLWKMDLICTLESFNVQAFPATTKIFVVSFS